VIASASGGFLGFPDSIATLRFISVPFWRMCKMPEMHPIVSYDPFGDLRWGNGLLSWDEADRQQWRGLLTAVKVVSILEDPDEALGFIELLEMTAPTVETVDLGIDLTERITLQDYDEGYSDDGYSDDDGFPPLPAPSRSRGCGGRRSGGSGMGSLVTGGIGCLRCGS